MQLEYGFISALLRRRTFGTLWIDTKIQGNQYQVGIQGQVQVRQHAR